MTNNIIRLHERSLKSLKTIGFAIQRFSKYRAGEGSITHGHDVLEVNFIASGRTVHTIGDMCRECGPGSLGIVHYGQEHSLTTATEAADVINLYLDPANHPLPALPPEFSSIIGSLFPPAPMTGSPRGLCCFLNFSDYRPMLSLLEYCCSEQSAMSPGYETAMESALRAFLIICARHAKAEGIETLASDSVRWRLLEGIRLRLEQDFADAHSLAELAEEAGVSKAHLCRRFKSYTGLPPFAYLAQCRIRAAMQELRSSDRKVLNIAMDVGFNDIGHFNRKFRELVKCSPREYRMRKY